MNKKWLLVICMFLSIVLLCADDMFGAFQIKTKPSDADVSLYDIDLYLCKTPSPVYPVMMDEYMVLQEGIPGRKINIIITKEGYIPLKKTIFVPFLYTKEKDALKHPTVFTFQLKHDYDRCYTSICIHYSLLCYRPIPLAFYYYPGIFWYPPPPGGYLHHPHHHPDNHHHGNCPPHPGHNPQPPPHPGHNPPIPPGGGYSGNGTGGHNEPPAGQGYGYSNAGYTPAPPSGKETGNKPDSLEKITKVKSVPKTVTTTKKEKEQDKDKKILDNSTTEIYHKVQTFQRSYRK